MGRSFQLGGDLVEMKRAVDEDDIPSLNKIAELVNTISFKIKQIPKPVLMEVDGAVAGAAANMAVAVDFCLATDKAKFILHLQQGLPHLDRARARRAPARGRRPE